MRRILAASAVAIALASIVTTASFAREWERLGVRTVGFVADRDKIEVGRREGKYKRLKLLVRGNDIELNRVKIVFGNGKVEDVRFNQHIRAGGESPAIDLRTPWRDGRFIKEVLLNYRSRLNFRGQAVIELWGQED